MQKDGKRLTTQINWKKLSMLKTRDPFKGRNWLPKSGWASSDAACHRYPAAPSNLQNGGIQSLPGHNFTLFWAPHTCMWTFLSLNVPKIEIFDQPPSHFVHIVIEWSKTGWAIAHPAHPPLTPLLYIESIWISNELPDLAGLDLWHTTSTTYSVEILSIIRIYDSKESSFIDNLWNIQTFLIMKNIVKVQFFKQRSGKECSFRKGLNQL